MGLPEADEKTSADGSGLRSYLLVGCLLLLYVFSFFDRMGIALVVDPIKADLGIDDTQVSLVVGLAFALSYSAGAIPLGALADRFSRRWILFTAATFWGVMTAACGLATSFVQLFIARFAVGLGEAPLHPASHSMISDAAPRNRLSTMISIYSAGAALGAGLALVVGGFIVHALVNRPPVDVPFIGPMVGWQLTFVAMGLPSVACAFLILLFREPQRRGGGQSIKAAPSSWADLLRFMTARWRLLTCYTMSFGGASVINGALFFWQPAYMSRFFKLNPAEYGLALGLITAGAGVGGLVLSGWAVDRMYGRGFKDAHMRYFFWSVLLSTPLVFVTVLTSSLWLFLALLIVVKLSIFNFLGISSSLIQMITPNRLRGRMAAVFASLVVGFSGTAFGPLVTALISQHVIHDEVRLGLSLAVTFAIFIPIILLGLWLGMKPLREAMQAADSWR